MGKGSRFRDELIQLVIAIGNLFALDAHMVNVANGIEGEDLLRKIGSVDGCSAREGVYLILDDALGTFFL